MSKKRALIYGLEKSSKSMKCRSIDACQNRTFVHDMKVPNDLKRKERAKIMVVGQSPGREEERDGRPLVGRSGKKVTSALKANGLEKNDVYFTNVVKCRTTRYDEKEKRFVNRTPKSDEVKACMPLLESEIKVLNPRAIVALGSTAIKALTGETLVKDALREKTLHHGGIPVIPTYHPSASRYKNVNEMRKIRELRVEAFKKAKELIGEG